MALNRLRQWLAKQVTKLNCLVNGHGEVQILTRYPDQQRVKFTGNLAAEKTRVTARQIQRVKARCGKCGKVFLDYAGSQW